MGLLRVLGDIEGFSRRVDRRFKNDQVPFPEVAGGTGERMLLAFCEALINFYNAMAAMVSISDAHILRSEERQECIESGKTRGISQRRGLEEGAQDGLQAGGIRSRYPRIYVVCGG